MKLNENKTINPLSSYVFIRTEPNPYIKTVENGLIISTKTSLGDADGASKKAETLEEVITFGTVIEVGPDVKTLQVGDEVYFDSRAQRPVPFGILNTMLLNEQNVIAFIRDKKEE